MYEKNELRESIPFGRVIQEFLESQENYLTDTETTFHTLESKLLAVGSIDIDFKKIVIEYWRTFLDSADNGSNFEIRARLLQWFEGIGTPAQFRRDFRIQKTVTKENARLMLQSLANFTKWMGFRGLAILFDEAEMTHTTMRKSSLRQAHNNLLHLINEIHDAPGIVLVYATVPSFFTDPVHGIQIYGALSQRIGELPSIQPTPLQRVWNIDKIEFSLDDQLVVCNKILQLYRLAYSEEVNQLPHDLELREQISELLSLRPKFSLLSSWRLAVTGTIQFLDHSLEGLSIPQPKLQYEGILQMIKDDED